MRATPPNPTARRGKLLDVSRLHALGWQAKTSFSEGVAENHMDYLQNTAEAAWDGTMNGPTCRRILIIDGAGSRRVVHGKSIGS